MPAAECTHACEHRAPGESHGRLLRSNPMSLTQALVALQMRAHSFDLHLAFVMKALRDACAGGVPVFVVIEAFDVFVNRPKQTLLYALLDLTQVGL